jgi:hypothetical protein
MTKKDYELIAGAIREDLNCYKDLTHEAVAVRVLARRLATQLESTNPRFNRELFLTACGVSGVN